MDKILKSEIEQIKLGIDYDQAKFYAEMNKKRIEFFNKMLSKYYYHLTFADIEGIKTEKEKFKKALTKNLKNLEEIKEKLNKTSEFYEVHTTGWADSKKQLLKKVIYMGNEYIFQKNAYIEENIDENGYTELYLKPIDMLVYGESPSEAYQYLAEEINDTYFLLFCSEYKNKLSKGSLDIKKYFKENIKVKRG